MTTLTASPRPRRALGIAAPAGGGFAAFYSFYATAPLPSATLLPRSGFVLP